MYKFLKILFLLALPSVLFGQIPEDKYRLYLTNKAFNEFSIENPEAFLSSKAIERRYKYQINISENDLPISTYYIDSLKSLGLSILSKSKWLNTIVVYTTDTNLLDTITNLSFVTSKQKVESNLSANSHKSLLRKIPQQLVVETEDYIDYGTATTQISMINGHTLHQNGYQGQGITIAVIDGGFYNVDILPVFDSLWTNNQIIGTKDFVDGDNQVFDASNHGMKVLSVMGANLPGQLVGTAPKANYWLLRSEQTLSEYSIEEDNWAAAAEFADSVGVDIINSSLGYSEFDDINQNYSYTNLDGNTTFITKAADIAASKGILVVNSAGNLGDDPWKYISAPADADSILTVGAVDSFASLAYFSGLGPTYDGRIKPNVSAMGYKTAVQGADGQVSVANGTSFSAPIISGMAACLWQYFPELNNMDIIRKIEESSHQFSNPDNELGYGIPDFGKAANLNDISLISVINNEALINTYPNPFNDKINIRFLIKINENVKIELYNSTGEILKSNNVQLNFYQSVFTFDKLSDYPPGIYFLKIQLGENYVTRILSKIH